MNAPQTTTFASDELNSIPSQNDYRIGRDAEISLQPWPRLLLRLAGTLAFVVSFDFLLLSGGNADVDAVRFSGWAIFFPVAAVSLLVGIVPRSINRFAGFVLVGIFLSSLRLLWQGNSLVVMAAMAQLVLLALALHQIPIRLPNFGLMLFLMIPNSIIDLVEQMVPILGLRRYWGLTAALLNLLLPTLVCTLFAGIFIVANPNWVGEVTKYLEFLFESIADWLIQKNPATLFVWAMTACISMGLMAPSLKRFFAFNWSRSEPTDATLKTSLVECKWYLPARNTLLGVIVLFSVYLIFEFSNFWFREFPEGFYYAGYAHQGAAWLAIALAATTIVLSIIFERSMMLDPRIASLKRLAWIWSSQNFLLGLAVVNRMWIYINYNGMTRMRIIGLFGIACVLCGLILVIHKIRQRRSFGWLVESQVWVLLITIYLAAMTPMDYIAHQYNVAEIKSGHLAPVVQIAEHEVSAEGWLIASQLVQSDDPVIQCGILAMLVEYQSVLAAHDASVSAVIPRRYDAQQVPFSHDDWRCFQFSRCITEQKIDAILNDPTASPSLAKLVDQLSTDPAQRHRAIQEFRDYAFQWY